MYNGSVERMSRGLSCDGSFYLATLRIGQHNASRDRFASKDAAMLALLNMDQRLWPGDSLEDWAL